MDLEALVFDNLFLSEKSKYYAECLSDILNYLQRHSVVLKRYKLNNAKGLEKMLKAFLDNTDVFVKYGESISLQMNTSGQIKLGKEEVEL